MDVNAGHAIENIRLENRQKLWDYWKLHPCVDCGETDPIVLEFDHIDEKRFEIAQMVGHSWFAILKEIQKCEVRCCNCHRRKTAERASWYQGIVK